MLIGVSDLVLKAMKCQKFGKIEESRILASRIILTFHPIFLIFASVQRFWALIGLAPSFRRKLWLIPTMIVINRGAFRQQRKKFLDGKTADWMEEVSDEQYQA